MPILNYMHDLPYAYLWHSNEHATLYSTGLHSFYINVANVLQYYYSFRFTGNSFTCTCVMKTTKVFILT